MSGIWHPGLICPCLNGACALLFGCEAALIADDAGSMAGLLAVAFLNLGCSALNLWLWRAELFPSAGRV